MSIQLHNSFQKSRDFCKLDRTKHQGSHALPPVWRRKHCATGSGVALSGKPGRRLMKGNQINWFPRIPNKWHHPSPHGQGGQGRTLGAIFKFTFSLIPFTPPTALSQGFYFSNTSQMSVSKFRTGLCQPLIGGDIPPLSPCSAYSRSTTSVPQTCSLLPPLGPCTGCFLCMTGNFLTLCLAGSLLVIKIWLKYFFLRSENPNNSKKMIYSQPQYPFVLLQQFSLF